MKSKSFEGVSIGDVLTGKVQLPDGVTRGKVLGAVLQVDLQMVLTHSHLELKSGRAHLYLHGELRGIGSVNEAGRFDGELAILYPKGGIWIVAHFVDGEPCGRWREYTTWRLLLPAKPSDRLHWENETGNLHPARGVD